MRTPHEFVIRYRILDAKRGVPQRLCKVQASRSEIRKLVEQGFIVKRRLFSEGRIKRLRRALSDVIVAERSLGNARINSCFGSDYLRDLLDKHQEFSALFRLKSTLSVARAVLGPQLRFDEVTARITDLSRYDPTTPWHIHLRVVPEPLPPFFAYPHAIECLLYLDDVNSKSGALCILPGSHRCTRMIYSANDTSDKPNQRVLTFRAGDCLLMHSNLWHRALPSAANQGLRRLIIFGYMPSWIYGEELGGAKSSNEVLGKMRIHPDPLVRELAGEFYWG